MNWIPWITHGGLILIIVGIGFYLVKLVKDLEDYRASSRDYFGRWKACESVRMREKEQLYETLSIVRKENDRLTGVIQRLESRLRKKGNKV